MTWNRLSCLAGLIPPGWAASPIARLSRLPLATLGLLMLVAWAGMTARHDAAPPLVRSWSAYGIFVGARTDGWIEVRGKSRARTNLGNGDHALPVILARPRDVTALTSRMREYIAAHAAVPSGSTGLSYGLGLSLGRTGGARNGVPVGWSFNVCESAAYSGVDPPLRLLDVLDSAAHAAQSVRSEPAPVDRTAPHDISEGACDRAMSRSRTAAIDSSRMLARGHSSEPPVETLARFIVGADGKVDPASFEFYPSIADPLRRTAISTITAGGWRAAKRDDVMVPQFAHQLIRFIDPNDASDVRAAALPVLTGFARWVPRADGLVEWWDLGRGEVFAPNEVEAWIAEVRAMQTRAGVMAVPPPSGGLGFDTPPESPWYVMMGARNGKRVTASYYNSSGQAALELSSGDCGVRGGFPLVQGNVAVDSSLRRAADAARAARMLRPTPALDTSRIYGETEPTCSATQLGGANAVMVTNDSLQTALDLPREALIGFVVGKAGRVDPRSVFVFGEWSAADRLRIVGAVSGLTYTVPRFAGYAVAQRAHLLIPAGLSATTSTDLIDRTCAVWNGRAAEVRLPASGSRMIEDDLAIIARQILSDVAKLTPSPQDGTLGLVLMPDGLTTGPRWVTPPRGYTGRPPWLSYQQFSMRNDGRSVAVEVTLVPSCP